MFCQHCGKEINEEWAICPNCGNSLKEKELSKESDKSIKKKSKKMWLVLGGIFVIIIVFFMLIGSEGTNEQEVLDKLQTFTSVYEGDDKYYFLSENEDWALTYTSENEFVSFENDTVIECFTEAFGIGCFSEGSVSDYGFSYDLSDNEARIYFDVDIEDGHLTIVSYNLSDKEYELMIDGEKWDTTDEFNDFVADYELAQSIESDVKAFEETLQNNELIIDDLLCINYDTLKSQFIPDAEVTEEVHSTEIVDTTNNSTDKKLEENNLEENDSSLTESNSNSWKQAYLDYLNTNGNSEYGYSLDYIDGDDIPELVIDYMMTAEGTHILTYKDGQIIDTPVGESVRYRLKENSICVSGGRMDVYYDIIYEIIDGVPTEKSRGEYGIFDYENMKYDEAGDIIYEYRWNGPSVSEYDYTTNLEIFNMQESENVNSAGNGYLYDIIEVLSHPVDITIINPYLNDNGYMSLLNQYVIMFDGIEGDKIHFNVTYNDTLIGSASATIINSTTAEYKNVNSELVIEFNVDYQELKIEGYMDTIDLSGNYTGCWG